VFACNAQQATEEVGRFASVFVLPVRRRDAVMLELTTPAAERALVDRCLRDDPAAREELFTNYHQRLKNALVQRFMLNSQRFQIAEELSLLVFEQLGETDYSQLTRFDAERVSLSKFLEQLAQHERWIQRRSPSGRQQTREVTLEGDHWEDHSLEPFLPLEVEDFRRTLTEKENLLLTECLEDVDSSTPPPDSAKRKALSRLRKKWTEFQRGE
jgi:hypothetical protein